MGSLGFPVICAFVVRAVIALLRVVCVCRAHNGCGRGGVCCVRAAVCLVCWWCVWVPVVASLGLGWRLCVGAGAVVPRHSLRGSFGGGVFPRSPLCVPSPLFLSVASPGALFPWCLVPDYPGCGGCAVGLGGKGGSLTLARVPSPGVSPWGGRCLHSPSGCNSVVRAVHLYPLRTIGSAP